MACYQPEYMTALFFGMGLSSLLPSAVALVQGAGGAAECTNVTTMNELNITVSSLQPVYDLPLFSVSVFYIIIAVLLCVSCISFLLLKKLPHVKHHRVKKVVHLHQEPPRKEGLQSSSSSSAESDVAVRQELLNSLKEEQMPRDRLSKAGYGWLLFVQAWVCALMHGVLPSVQAYSCLPYGYRALHLSITLANISNPIACFVPLWYSSVKLKAISAKAFLGTAVGVYILLLAATSPTPPLQDSPAGEVLVVSIQQQVTY